MATVEARGWESPHFFQRLSSALQISNAALLIARDIETITFRLKLTFPKIKSRVNTPSRNQ